MPGGRAGMAYENRFRYEVHDLIYDLSCRHGAELCVQESHFMTVIDQLREVRWRVRRNDRLEGFQDALPKTHRQVNNDLAVCACPDRRASVRRVHKLAKRF
jgi:hypothetical protein